MYDVFNDYDTYTLDFLIRFMRLTYGSVMTAGTLVTTMTILFGCRTLNLTHFQDCSTQSVPK